MGNRGFYIAAALFLVAVGIFYVWDQGKPPATPAGTPSPSPLAAPILTVDANDVTSVVIKSKDKVLTVSRDNAATTYSLCGKDDQACPAQPADPNRVAALFSAIANLRPTSTAYGAASRLADFNLEQPSAEVTIKAKSGTYVLQAGGKSPDGASDYLRKSDGQDVYAVPVATFDSQVVGLVDNPPRVVPTPSPVASPALSPAPAPLPS